MSDSRVSLGPWPLGVDNVHPLGHAVFQLPDVGKPPPRLALANNVVLDDEGWPSTRQKTKQVAILLNGEGLTQVGTLLLYQAGGCLYDINSATPLVTGLVRRAVLSEFGGRIYGTDGTSWFEIADSTVRGWGLPVPTVALASATGSTFSAGTYQVDCTFVDTRNEGGCSTTATITLASASNIQVTVTGLDYRVAGINQYISEVNQPATSFAKLVATSGVGSQVFSASAATTVNSHPGTKRMHGPPTGLTGMFPFRAFLMAYRDGAVFRSQAQEPHLFRSSEWVYQVPGEIRGGGGLPSGFALGTDQGIWWLTGDEPPYVGVRKTTQPVLKGAMVVDGWRLPFLQIPDPVVLFVQKTGIAVVSPSGNVIPITQDRYHVNTGAYTEAQFAFLDRQLLVRLG